LLDFILAKDQIGGIQTSGVHKRLLANQRPGLIGHRNSIGSNFWSLGERKNTKHNNNNTSDFQFNTSATSSPQVINIRIDPILRSVYKNVEL